MSASNGWSYQMVGACSFSPDTKSWTDSLGSPPSRKLAEGSLGEDFAIEVSRQCPIHIIKLIQCSRKLPAEQ